MRSNFVAAGSILLVALVAGLPAAEPSQENAYRDKAVAAARHWRFSPMRFENRPVGQDDDFTRGTYRPGTEGLVEPKAVRRVSPKYTSDAMRARIQGTVVVEVVVLPDGTVGRARIKESLDKIYGLDESALEAARKYLFAPGTLDGTPVPVLIELRLEFRLH